MGAPPDLRPVLDVLALVLVAGAGGGARARGGGETFLALFIGFCPPSADLCGCGGETEEAVDGGKDRRRGRRPN
jgi:hypothetical protein